MKFWTNIERKRRKYIARYYREIRRELKAMALPMFDYLKYNPNIEDLRNILPTLIKTERIEKTMIELYGTVGKDFAGDLRSMFVRKKSDEDDLWEAYLQEYARKQAGKKVVSIVKYTRRQFEAAIQEQLTIGLEQGKGTQAIADMFIRSMSREWNEDTAWRAMRIAQTEVIGASNRASYEAASQSGYMMKKIWITAPIGVAKNERHAVEGAIENKEVMINQPFIVNGVAMDCPGDDAGGPENVINCRCAIAYEIL